MKRLQRECLTLSTVLHGVLLAIAFLGTAFLAKPKPPELTEPVTILDFVPDELVDENVASRGGATPTPPADPPPQRPADPPPRQPQRPDPAPIPPRKPDPPPKEPVREVKPAAEEPQWKPRSSKEIKVDLNKVTKTRTATQRAAEEARRQREREAKAAVQDSLNRLQSHFQTEISFNVPGDVGGSYANYGAYVRTIYSQAWRKPASGVAGNPIAKVRVVIARDGRVQSSGIIKSSGQPAMDRSVQTVLDRVKNIGRPFPKDAEDTERSFILTFDLKVKFGLG